jgi:aspartyl/asparaginyl beta-hydroxylase (cupin superfamily)
MAGEVRARIRKRVIRFGKRMRPRLNAFLASQSRVPQLPVFDSTAFPFIAGFERDWSTIRREFDQIYSMRDQLPAFHEISPDQKRISKGQHWKTFVLYGFGAKSLRNCAKCPATAEALASVPGLQSALFSIIDPGYRIPPHHGVTKGIVRAHLGLKVPVDRDRCFMRVGDQRVTWREGACVVFDDSFEHEVHNDTDETRAVLLFDFDRPMRPLGRLVHRSAVWVLKRSPFFRDAQRNLTAWEDRFEQSYAAMEATLR